MLIGFDGDGQRGPHLLRLTNLEKANALVRDGKVRVTGQWIPGTGIAALARPIATLAQDLPEVGNRLDVVIPFAGPPDAYALTLSAPSTAPSK